MSRGSVLSNGSRTARAASLGMVLWLGGCGSPAPETPAFSYRANFPRTIPNSDAPAPVEVAPAPILAAPAPPASQPAEPSNGLAFPTGNRETSVVLLEQTGPAEAHIGVPYTYELRVTNLTNLPVSGVVLDQEVPGDFKLSSSPAVLPAATKATTQQSAAAQTHARIEIGELGPRESKTVRVTGTPSRAGAVETTLSVQFNPPALRSHITVVAPILKVVAKGPAEADICQEILCHYTVTNIGSGVAHSVVLEEKLPEGMLSAESQSVISIPLGDLAPGESKDYSAHLRAVRPAKYATRVSVVSSDAPAARAEQINTAVLAPRLTITITAPRESYFNQPLTYQVSVTNRGEAPATRTRLRLGTTAGRAQFVSADSPDGKMLGTMSESGEQDLGTFSPGQTRTISAHFRPTQGGPITVDATALADCAEPVAASASTKIVTVAASSLTVTHDPDPVAIGNNVVYHITVQNKGTAADQNVMVSALLPASTQFIRASGGTEAKADAQTIRFTPIATLAPGQSVSWQVEARAMRGDDAQFLASMTSASYSKPVVRLESTTFFGIQSGTVTGTSDTNPAAPATQPAQLNK